MLSCALCLIHLSVYDGMTSQRVLSNTARCHPASLTAVMTSRVTYDVYNVSREAAVVAPFVSAPTNLAQYDRAFWNRQVTLPTTNLKETVPHVFIEHNILLCVRWLGYIQTKAPIFIVAAFYIPF